MTSTFELDLDKSICLRSKVISVETYCPRARTHNCPSAG